MSLFATHSELILSLAKLTSALLIAFAVEPFLKRSALRAAFWAGVLLILPTVILATHGRGIVNILPLPSSAEQVETVPAVMSPAPAAPVVMSPAPAAPVIMSPPSSAPVAIPTTLPLAATPSDKTVSQKIPEVQKSPTNWVAVVFFTGLALSLLPTLLSLLQIAFAPKKPANNETLALWESIRPQGMQTVPLYVTSSPSAPFTAGLVRTAILLPESSVDWSPRRLRSTLHHEAAHIARRDILVRMAASLVRAVLWFHPLVWLAHRKLVAAQEEACDEIALSAGIPPDEYAEDLLETAKHSQFAFAHSLHMARWSQLGYRIQTILHYKQTTQKPTNMKTIAAAILGITVVTCGLSTVGFSQTPEAAQAPAQVAQTPKTAKPEEIAEKTEAQTAMEEKLKQIMIPEIDFEDTSLEEAMDFIRYKTREHDEYEKNPAKKGINIVVKLPEGEESPQIKELRINNVPAGVALKYICDLTGLQYKVEEFAVLIAPLDSTHATAQQAPEPPSPIRPPQPNNPLAKDIAFTVNDRVITREELDFFLAPYQERLVAEFPGRGEQFEAKLKEARDQVIRELIDRQIIHNELVKLGASIKPDLIDAEIKLKIREDYNGDEAQFREDLKHRGFTLDRYRELIRWKLEMWAIRPLLFSDVPPSSPKEIEKEYEEVKALYRDTSKDVISFRKILIPSSNPDNPAVTPESQLLLAKDLVRQLSEGKDFSELAKTHSKDASAANGGLQENVPRHDLKPNFASVLFEATVGEVLGPLSFPSGFVIAIPDKIEFAPSPPLDDELRKVIEQRVQHKKTSALYVKWIENQRKQAIIKFQD